MPPSFAYTAAYALVLEFGLVLFPICERHATQDAAEHDDTRLHMIYPPPCPLQLRIMLQGGAYYTHE